MRNPFIFTLLLIPVACGSPNQEDAATDAEPATAADDSALACGNAALHTQTHDACTAMDAEAIPDPDLGSCFCMLGYAWDGSACVPLTDCFCQGEDCNKLTLSLEQCQAAHADCTEPVDTTQQRLSCGDQALFAASHDACAAMDAEAVPDPDLGSCFCMLGYAWDGSACVSLTDCFCQGEDCDKLTLSLEQCQAAHADCAEPIGTVQQHLSCGDQALFAASHDACAAMDAEAVPDPDLGSCFCMLGYAWDGSACVSLTDCFCQGEDCDKLTLSLEECQAAHADCG
jgi:hypothetical protein